MQKKKKKKNKNKKKKVLGKAMKNSSTLFFALKCHFYLLNSLYMRTVKYGTIHFKQDY
jgi:hypothetical protein